MKVFVTMLCAGIGITFCGCSFTTPNATVPALQAAAGGNLAGHTVTVQMGACMDGGFPYMAQNKPASPPAPIKERQLGK